MQYARHLPRSDIEAGEMVGPRTLVQGSSDTDGQGDDEGLPTPTYLLEAIDHGLVTQDLKAV
jgi:hypothetical protein